jgi:hypothetical protein
MTTASISIPRAAEEATAAGGWSFPVEEGVGEAIDEATLARFLAITAPSMTKDVVDEVLEEPAEKDDDESECSEEYEMPQDTYALKLKSQDTYHRVCVDRFDTDYPEDSDPAQARDFEAKAVEQIGKLMRNDMCNTIVPVVPKEDQDKVAHVIPVGITSKCAVALTVGKKANTKNQLNPDEARQREAAKYADAVCADIRAAETIDEVKSVDQAFCQRADMDYLVEAESRRVGRVIKKKMRQLEKQVSESSARARDDAEGEAQKEKQLEEAREKMGLPKEHPLAQDPRLTSFLRPRPLDSITCISGVAQPPGRNKKQLLCRFEDAGALERHTKATKKANAAAKRKAEKEELRRRKEMGKEMSMIGTLRMIVEDAEFEADRLQDGETLNVSMPDLLLGLLIADVNRDRLTKRQQKIVRKARAMYDAASNGETLPSMWDGEMPMCRSIKVLADQIRKGAPVAAREVKVSLFIEQSKYTAETGSVIPPEELFPDIKKCEAFLNYSTPPKERDLSTLIKVVGKVRNREEPALRELQRALVQTEKAVGVLKLKEDAEVDPKHELNLKAGRQLIEAHGEKARPLEEMLKDAENVTVRELDARIAYDLMRQWDGKDGFGEMSVIQRAQQLLAELLVEETYRKQAELLAKQEAGPEEAVSYDFPAIVKVADVADVRNKPLKWVRAAKHSRVQTTGACATSRNTPEFVVGRTMGVSVHALPTGTVMLDLVFHKSWGGRVTQVSMDDRFVCGLFDYPEGIERTTRCSAFVYHRKSQKLHLLDSGAVALTCIEPEPARESYWLGTESGGLFCISWELGSFDPTVQGLLIAATIAPVSRIRRIGRRLHALAGSDLFSWDVVPLEGESLKAMASRAGRPRRHPLGFPSDVARWGPIHLVLQRDYKLRLMHGDMVRVLPGTMDQQKLERRHILHPFPNHQHLRFERDMMIILYGDGSLRALWPGTTASQYEADEVMHDRIQLQKLMQVDNPDTETTKDE